MCCFVFVVISISSWGMARNSACERDSRTTSETASLRIAPRQPREQSFSSWIESASGEPKSDHGLCSGRSLSPDDSRQFLVPPKKFAEMLKEDFPCRFGRYHK